MALLWPLLVKVGVAAFLTLLAAFVGRRLLKRWEKRSEERAKIPRCTCGYPLAGLTLARCPECGRVLGFNATAEELGLGEKELRRVIEMRERRKAEDQRGG